MSYVVDRRQIGVGFNWDGSSNRVLRTLESLQFAKIPKKLIIRKVIVKVEVHLFFKEYFTCGRPVAKARRAAKSTN